MIRTPEAQSNWSFSKMTSKSFIEVQFPIGPLSLESYKERDAKGAKALSSLGKWWGAKPLVLTRAIIIGSVIGIMLTLLWSNSIGFGFITGAAVSILNFQFMSVDAYRIVGTTPAKARKFIIGRSVIRYTIIFCFLALIFSRTDFNIFAAFAGLFFVQMLLIIGQLLHAVRTVFNTPGS